MTPNESTVETGPSKRGVILREARIEFAARGFDGTHISTISSRAGIRKSTFFHYFTDKEALYADAVVASLFNIADRIDVAVSAARDFDGQLDALLGTLHRQLAHDVALPRLMLRTFVDTHLGEDHPASAAAPMSRIAKRTVAIIEQGIRDGALADVDARPLAASILMTVCVHELRSPITPLTRDLPDDRYESLRSHVLRALPRL